MINVPVDSAHALLIASIARLIAEHHLELSTPHEPDVMTILRVAYRDACAEIVSLRAALAASTDGGAAQRLKLRLDLLETEVVAATTKCNDRLAALDKAGKIQAKLAHELDAVRAERGDLSVRCGAIQRALDLERAQRAELARKLIRLAEEIK